MPSRIKLIAPTQYLLFTKTIDLTLNKMFRSIGYEYIILKRFVPYHKYPCSHKNYDMGDHLMQSIVA